MEKVINSISTDGSTYSYYGSITIKNGKIVKIFHELGREGGDVWYPGFNENGSKKQCMKSIGRDWPKLYNAVRKMCPKENLPSLNKIRSADLKTELKSKTKELIQAESRVKLLNKEVKRLQKKLRH
jgi:hypothetical protein